MGEFHIVTGKGGVGKTTIAAAMAARAARTGRRVLLAEVQGDGRAASACGHASVRGRLVRQTELLWSIDLWPESSLLAYGNVHLRSKFLSRLVFGNRAVRSLVAMVPSLTELVMLGQLFHLLYRDPGFDTLMFDAPATGHLLSLLRAPATAQELAQTGPFLANASWLVDCLQSTATILHVVTTPNHAALAESGQLLAELSLALPKARREIVVNRRLEKIQIPNGGNLDLLSRQLGADIRSAVEHHDAERRAGEQLLNELMSTNRVGASISWLGHSPRQRWLHEQIQRQLPSVGSP